MTDKLCMLGVAIDNLDSNEVLSYIDACIKYKKKSIVSNVNVNAMNIAYTDPRFKCFLNQCDLNFCDGAGVILAARIIGKKIVERITYAEWFWRLAEFAEKNQYTIYFLGAGPGVAFEAAEKTKKKFPRIKILGVHSGYFDKNPDSLENKIVVDQINQVEPHILILGMGMPTQEYWIAENWANLEVTVTLTGGAVFDYVSGYLRRPPRWMTDNGFEWFGRLIIEPRRLWKRYVIGNPLFFLRIFVHHILNFPLPN